MNAYLNLDYTDWAQFKRDADKASQRLLMAETLMAGDHFLATIFFNGEEPDWANEIQRKAAFELRDAMARLAVELGVATIRETNTLAAYSEREKGGGSWPTTEWQAIRKRIFTRDGKVCGHCKSTEDLAIDHMTPRCRGGTDDEDNLWVLCRSCNSSKGAKTIEEFTGLTKADLRPDLFDDTSTSKAEHGATG